MEAERDTGLFSFAWLAQIGPKHLRRRSDRRLRVVGWICDGLLDDSRHLLCRSDSARTGGVPISDQDVVSRMQYWLDSLSLQNPTMTDLWWFLPFGFILTVLIESPILWIGLPKLPFHRKLWFGVWLTACTYPVVVLVLPALMVGFSRGVYLLIAESFAPLAECCIFWLALRGTIDFARRDWIASFATIVVANLASFVIGENIWINGVI